MISYNKMIQKFQSHSGEFHLIEEKSNNDSKLYIGLQLSKNYQQEQLQNERNKKDEFFKLRQLRHFIKMIDSDNKYYLFKYVNGTTIEDFIKEKRSAYESINQQIIDDYVGQILEALFQLHKLNILGRIFSTENIINKEGTLVLMDFGYGPDLKQNKFNILAPPETIKELYLRNHEIPNQEQSVLKIDSWLLGAFLFHLVKLRPINSIKNPKDDKKMQIFKYSDLQNYYQFIEEQSKSKNFIVAETNRYNYMLINFIHGLLTYDSKKRFSFLDIYQSEYIRSLNLPNQQQYVEFYKNFNEEEIFENLQIRDRCSESFVLNTQIIEKFQVPAIQIGNRNQNNQEEETLSQNNYQQNILESSPSIENNKKQTKEINKNNSEQHFLPFHFSTSYIKDSKYEGILFQLNMDLFRYIILNETASQIKKEYPQENYKLSQIVQYVLIQQSSFVLQELFDKLKSPKYPWQKSVNEENLWEEFKKDNKYLFFKFDLIEIKFQLDESIKLLFIEISNNSQVIQQFISQQNNNEDIKRNINKQNLHLFVDNIINNKYQFHQIQDVQISQNNTNNQDSKQQNCNSNQDQSIRDDQQIKWSIGYKMIINDLFKYFEKYKEDINYKQKYSHILLKLLYCRLINKIFTKEYLKSNFNNIECVDKNKITPDEIYSFIQSQENYNKKYEEIEELMKNFFPKNQNEN